MNETSAKEAGSRFPTTRISLIAGARAPDPATRRGAYETLLRSYWKPAYTYLRLRWRMDREEAEDRTQSFFAKAFESGFLEPFEPERARFRTWIRLCLDRFVANERQHDARQKRGGGGAHVPLDFVAAEEGVQALAVSHTPDPESLFHREWVRHLFELSVSDLRERCVQGSKRDAFTVFERYDLHDGSVGRPSYAELAAELDLPITQITNHLAWGRREFRRLVLERLRDATGSEDEFRAEAREILGTDPL